MTKKQKLLNDRLIKNAHKGPSVVDKLISHGADVNYFYFDMHRQLNSAINTIIKFKNSLTPLNYLVDKYNCNIHAQEESLVYTSIVHQNLASISYFMSKGFDYKKPELFIKCSWDRYFDGYKLIGDLFTNDELQLLAKNNLDIGVSSAGIAKYFIEDRQLDPGYIFSVIKTSKPTTSYILKSSLYNSEFVDLVSYCISYAKDNNVKYKISNQKAYDICSGVLAGIIGSDFFDAFKKIFRNLDYNLKVQFKHQALKFIQTNNLLGYDPVRQIHPNNFSEFLEYMDNLILKTELTDSFPNKPSRKPSKV